MPSVIYSDQMINLLKIIYDRVSGGEKTWGSFGNRVLGISGPIFSDDALKRARGIKDRDDPGVGWPAWYCESFEANLMNSLWAASTSGNARTPKEVLCIIQTFLNDIKMGDSEVMNDIARLSEKVEEGSWVHPNEEERFKECNMEEFPEFFEACDIVVSKCVRRSSPKQEKNDAGDSPDGTPLGVVGGALPPLDQARFSMALLHDALVGGRRFAQWARLGEWAALSPSGADVNRDSEQFMREILSDSSIGAMNLQTNDLNATYEGMGDRRTLTACRKILLKAYYLNYARVATSRYIAENYIDLNGITKLATVVLDHQELDSFMQCILHRDAAKGLLLLGLFALFGSESFAVFLDIVANLPDQ